MKRTIPVTPSFSDRAPFQLSALKFVTKKAFHDGWKTQGSFAKVSRKVGYELRLAELKIGSKGRVELKVANDCWARPAHARAIVLKAYRKGKLRGEVRLTEKLDTAFPAKTVVFNGVLHSFYKSDRICLSAPDISPGLATNLALSIRFANADINGQAWYAALKAFCLSVKLGRNGGT